MKKMSSKVGGVIVVVAVAVAAVFVFRWFCPCSPTPLKTSLAKPVTISRKVLIVHSYDPEYPWTERIDAGIRKGLGEISAEVQTFYMDTKRRSDEASKIAAGKKAAEMVTEWKPDVVIASDDNAQKYFASSYAGQATPQVVFCGVNGDANDYGYPASNVTGVLERPYFEETLKFLAMLRPGFRRISLISEDSLTAMLASRYMRTTNPSFEVRSSTMCNSFEEWQIAVKNAQDNADAIGINAYHSLKRAGTDESVPPDEVIRWTLANSRVPVVGFLDFAIEDGALCGMVESPEEQGLRAGQLARMILGGRKPSEFPIVESGLHGRKMLNLDTAEKLGIRVPDFLGELVEVVSTKEPAAK